MKKDGFESKEFIRNLNEAFKKRQKEDAENKRKEREAEEAAQREKSVKEIEAIKGAIIERQGTFIEKSVVYEHELEDFYRVLGEDEYSPKCWYVWMPLNEEPTAITQQWISKRGWTLTQGTDKNGKSKYCLKVDPDALHPIINFFKRIRNWLRAIFAKDYIEVDEDLEDSIEEPSGSGNEYLLD